MKITVDKIERETNKAIAIYPYNRFVWLPKSKVEIKTVNNRIQVEVPDYIWLNNFEKAKRGAK